MGCGFSRDDAGSFLPLYTDEFGIYEDDPFEVLDQTGVDQLVANPRKTAKKKYVVKIRFKSVQITNSKLGTGEQLKTASGD
jgi:hypothetical protein